MTDSESEDNFEDGLNFQDQEVEEDIAGIRRRISDEVAVSRVGEALNQTLGPDRDEGAEPRDHFSPVQVRFPVNAPALRPPIPEVEVPVPAVTMVNYDAENGVDKEHALQNACRTLKGYEWDDDLSFYFNQVEIKMKSDGVFKNFTKLQVLSTILPKRVIEQIKPILRKQETDFPNNNAYLLAKQQIIRTFGASQEADYERACSRVLSGKPSELARSITNDICKKSDALDGCCCSHIVLGMWKKNLPLAVKQKIAGMEFNKDTFDSVCQQADDVFNSTRPAQVAPMVAAVTGFPPQIQGAQPEPSLDETQPAIQYAVPGSFPAVAAVQYYRGGGRGQWRGGRGNGRGGGRGQNRGGRGNRGSHRRMSKQREQRDV